MVIIRDKGYFVLIARNGWGILIFSLSLLRLESIVNFESS